MTMVMAPTAIPEREVDSSDDRQESSFSSDPTATLTFTSDDEFEPMMTNTNTNANPNTSPSPSPSPIAGNPTDSSSTSTSWIPKVANKTKKIGRKVAEKGGKFMEGSIESMKPMWRQVMKWSEPAHEPANEMGRKVRSYARSVSSSVFGTLESKFYSLSELTDRSLRVYSHFVQEQWKNSASTLLRLVGFGKLIHCKRIRTVIIHFNQSTKEFIVQQSIGCVGFSEPLFLLWSKSSGLRCSSHSLPISFFAFP